MRAGSRGKETRLCFAFSQFLRLFNSLEMMQAFLGQGPEGAQPTEFLASRRKQFTREPAEFQVKGFTSEAVRQSSCCFSHRGSFTQGWGIQLGGRILRTFHDRGGDFSGELHGHFMTFYGLSRATWGGSGVWISC